MRHPLVPAVLAALSLACAPEAIPGTQVKLALDGELAGLTFFDAPIPSDLRLKADGSPDFAGFPNPGVAGVPNPTIEKFRRTAEERSGWPTVPAAYFRFDGPLSPQDPKTVIAASLDAPVLLADVDPASPERGKLYPVVAALPAEDSYVPDNLLAIAPRPGVVLPPNRRFAFIVRRSLNDAEGRPLGVPLAVAQAADGEPLARGAAKVDTASVWASLPGLDPETVAAFTVFTTGDVVAELHALGNRIVEKYRVKLDSLAVDTDDGASHARYCELRATISFPQFQKGAPPFDAEGLFELGADGLPVKQREETAPVTITLPKGEMPAAGFPLMLYFHGSGGLSREVADRGRTPAKDGEPAKGEGPAHVVAPFGLATASTAFPINPERVPGASDFAYVNTKNLAMIRDLFRQGVVEQRMFVELLRTLEIPPETLAPCAGVTLPAGATRFRFDPDKLVAMGHSMGAMYLNMVTATEPRIRAGISSGAGGYWTYFLLETKLVPGASLLRSLLGADGATLDYLHPAVQLAEAALETVDPLVFTPRVARRPLSGFASRPVYQPAGLNDRYFPPQVLDALALGYGHRQAGPVVWGSMQEALALEGKGGVIGYPVKDNLRSESGAAYTGVVVQWESDGIADPHNVAFQLDEVKHQYGCFLSSFLATGRATLPAPAPLGTPCP